MTRIILASGNKHKFEEIHAILGDYDVELVPMSELGINSDDIEETEDSFEGNALLKAEAVMKECGNIVIADDSGLEVDALDGRPGVYSARYAGENATFDDNNKKLLEEMKNVPTHLRGAKFVSVLVCLFPDGEHIIARGEVDGIITEQMRGDAGFGYDPLFYVKELDKTYAELSADEKNSISHRSKALEILKKQLDKKLVNTAENND